MLNFQMLMKSLLNISLVFLTIVIQYGIKICFTVLIIVPFLPGRGGDGVVRELLFRRPLTLSILTERRVFAPYGLEGQLKNLSCIFVSKHCQQLTVVALVYLHFLVDN